MLSAGASAKTMAKPASRCQSMWLHSCNQCMTIRNDRHDKTRQDVPVQEPSTRVAGEEAEGGVTAIDCTDRDVIYYAAPLK